MFSKLQTLPERDKWLLALSLSVSTFILVFSLFFPFDAEEYASFGYLGVAVANLLGSAAVISFVPAFAATFAAAGSLNHLTLVFLSATMSSIGEMIDYFLGDGIDAFVKHYSWHKTLEKWFMKSPFLFLVIWVAIPNPIQALGQIFAGTTHYPMWKYFLSSWIGNLIWFTLVVKAGEALL